MEKLESENTFSEKALYDIKLVERALKENDQKAYTELLKRYQEIVYYMLLRMVNNKDDAEDLTIEAFGKAFNNLDQYSTNYAFSTWLFKIASNNAIDFLRRNREHRRVTSLNKPVIGDEGEEYSALVKGTEMNPEESIVNKQTKEVVKVIMEKLKPNYREIVRLFYFEELSIDDIAKQLDMPVSNVKVRLFRARDLLYTMARRSRNL